MKITERFAVLDDGLKLDPDERQLAQDLHNDISRILVDAGLAKQCRLQGSFARKTMLPPLHDVDKVIELRDELRDELEGPTGPRDAIERIKALLGAEYPGAIFTTKKHSLGICFPGHDFDFDAVPAFTSVGRPGWVDIANTLAGFDEPAWKPSNTYELIDVIRARNGECGGRFVRQVRMVKQVIAHAELAKALPGLHVESFTFWAVPEEMDHAAAVAASLAMASDLLGNTYTDPTGVDTISDRLDYGVVLSIKASVADLSSRAAQALALDAAGDEVGAAQLWADLLGEPFPAPTDADIKEAEQRHAVENLYAGGTLARTNRPAPSSRAWRP